jgi:hypothetical protein
VFTHQHTNTHTNTSCPNCKAKPVVTLETAVSRRRQRPARFITHNIATAVYFAHAAPHAPPPFGRSLPCNVRHSSGQDTTGGESHAAAAQGCGSGADALWSWSHAHCTDDK